MDIRNLTPGLRPSLLPFCCCFFVLAPSVSSRSLPSTHVKSPPSSLQYFRVDGLTHQVLRFRPRRRRMAILPEMLSSAGLALLIITMTKRKAVPAAVDSSSGAFISSIRSRPPPYPFPDASREVAATNQNQFQGTMSATYTFGWQRYFGQNCERSSVMAVPPEIPHFQWIISICPTHPASFPCVGSS